MSLIRCDLADEEEARITQTAREYTVWYKAFLSKQTDGVREILLGAPKLNVYSPHPVDPEALVAEVFPKRIRGTNIFDLQIRYSTDVDFAASPLAQPAEISIESVLRNVPALLDVNGNLAINTAGDLLDDPIPEVEIFEGVIKISKNIPILLPSWVSLYNGAVTNSDGVQIRNLQFPPGTLKLASVSIGAEQNVGFTSGSTINSVPFCVCEVELNYRADGWTTLIPNRGFFQLVPKNRQQVVKVPSGNIKKWRFRTIPDGYTRQRVTVGDPPDYPPEPVFLDVNGAMITSPNFSNIVMLEFDFHDKVQFSNVLPGCN